jgi:DNA invertase Pin-like site-specific DNA recombinase
MEAPRRAAEYMRMSTEQQQYSIANQAAAIQEYANANGIEIVRTYVDRGKSGLDLKRRPGLRALLDAATAGKADFSVLLVYDVSRWGRFQDVDESAYYEYSLKKSGVDIIYCAEAFSDIGNPADALLKTLKRAMAAEYSRDLSRKVAQGQRRIAGLGFRLGGISGYGLRRVAVDVSGRERIVLNDGEQKSVKTDRVKLLKGPPDEVKLVRSVFAMFTDDGLGETEIATRLNAEGHRTRLGNPWTREPVYRMLTNPKYAGDLAYCRTVTRIGCSATPNERNNWIYLPDQFPAIVSREVWNRAQEVYRKRKEYSSQAEMLRLLSGALAKHGTLSYDLIDAEKGVPSAQTYHRYFGSIYEAYRRIGWKPSIVRQQTTRLPQARECRLALNKAVDARLTHVAAGFEKDAKLPLWHACGLSIYVALTAARKIPKRRLHWKFAREISLRKVHIDVLIVARLNPETTAVRDFYVFAGEPPKTITLYEHNPQRLELHRFADLSFIELLCSSDRVEAEGRDE